MSIGIYEAVVVLCATAVFLPLAFSQKKMQLAVLPLFLLAAMLTTPADVVSQLAVGIPNALLCMGLIRFSERHPDPAATTMER